MLMRPDLIDPKQLLPLWQSDVFVRALRLIGQDAAIETLNAVGQALVIRRRLGPFGTISFTSRGPLWADKATPRDQIAALRESQLRVINANADLVDVLPRAGYRRLAKPKDLTILPVFGDLDQQLAACHGKWRNAYRCGLRSSLTTRHRNFDLLKDHWLFGEDAIQQRTKGYRAFSPDLVRAIVKVDPCAVRLSYAMEGKTIIAAMLFLQHGFTATYHIGWTNDAGRAANAHHVLLIQAAHSFAKQGVRQIDLGLYHPKTNAGLARFKRRSGAKVMPLGGTWVRMPFL